MIKNINFTKYCLPFLFFILLCPSFSYGQDNVMSVMDSDGQKILNDILEKDTLGTQDIKNDVKNLRPDSLRETAKILGLQKAVKWRYEQIFSQIKKYENKLDQIFDFSTLLMYNGKVLPPVIVETRNSYSLESDKKATSVDATYRIIKEAKLVTTLPSWRDYLERRYTSFSRKDIQVGVLPKNDEERKIWEEAALEGWKMGIRQANRLFRQRLNKLVRDYRGILKFKLLAEQNIVDVPILAKGELGVVVDGQKLNVDQRVFRLTAPGKFNARIKKWKPKIGIEESGDQQ